MSVGKYISIPWIGVKTEVFKRKANNKHSSKDLVGEQLSSKRFTLPMFYSTKMVNLGSEHKYCHPYSYSKHLKVKFEKLEVLIQNP